MFFLYNMAWCEYSETINMITDIFISYILYLIYILYLSYDCNSLTFSI